MLLFYEMENVPVNSVLLLSTRKEAIDFPKGDIKLGYCHSCGFITNMVFNPGQVEYSSRYEATQSFSPTFDSYLRKLASQLVEKYDLFKKNIIEIGCGQGEFLSLLCEIGKNSGVGFDPAYDASRNHGVVQKNITFIKDFFSENYSTLKSEFICCRMTLEHIQDTNRFINMIQRSIKESPNAIIFFQVPNVARILQELAFWDIYYEHCSYFSLTSLSQLFRLCGFDILDLETDYDGQYLSITARSTNNLEFLYKQENIPETITNDVIYFKNNYINEIKKWREKINQGQTGWKTYDNLGSKL